MKLLLLLLSLLAALQVASSTSNSTCNRQCSNSSDVCELNKKILRNLCKLLMICKDPQSACKTLEQDSENGISSSGGSGSEAEGGIVGAQETNDQSSEGNGDAAEGTLEEGLVQAQDVQNRPAGNRTRPAGGTNSTSSGSRPSSNSKSPGSSPTSTNSTSSNPTSSNSTSSNSTCSCACQQPIQLNLECNSTCCPCQTLIPIQITVNNRTNSSFTLLLTYSNPSCCGPCINACLNCGSTCVANVSNTNNSTQNAHNSSSNSTHRNQTASTTEVCGPCGPRRREPCSRGPICPWNNSPRRPHSYRDFCAYDVNLARAVKPFSNMNQNNMTMNQKHYCPEETPVILDDDCW